MLALLMISCAAKQVVQEPSRAPLVRWYLLSNQGLLSGGDDRSVLDSFGFFCLSPDDTRILVEFAYGPR